MFLSGDKVPVLQRTLLETQQESLDNLPLVQAGTDDLLSKAI